jgi:hypothetical protein
MNKHLFAALALAVSSPGLAETWIVNANGVQVGMDGKLQRFTGLLVGDDGKVIRTTGPLDDIGVRGQVIDAGGRTLLPGLIDAHGHVMGLGEFALLLDLVGTASLADLQQRLGTYAASRPDDPWIVGRGWNQELWPDNRFPTAADLEAVVSDRPVVLERVDGHAVVVNSAALKAAGVSAATRDPVGGKIERDSRGNPTGLLIDAASELVTRKVPAATPAQRDQALAEAQRALLSVGVTATADMGTSADGWTAMENAARSGRLAVRILSYSAGLEPLERIARNGPSPWLFGDRLRAVGVKLYADGALGSRGAFLKQPYADKPDTRGLRFLTDAELRAQAESAASRGFQLAVHAIGDAGNAQVVSAFEELSRKYGANRRWRIEHFQVADPADIPRLAPAGIIASMQPVHQTSDRLMAEKRLGPDRLDGAYAWQLVLKSGARLAFGSDYPVESPNPFPGLAAAISRQDMQGQPPGGWIPAERLSFEQALAAFTRDAAYAGFAEDRMGALEPGKWADFILVDRDPSKVDAQALARTQVLETWVAGKKVWQRAATAGGERGR